MSIKSCNMILWLLFFFNINVISEAAVPCSFKFKEIQVPPILGDNFSDGATRFKNYRTYGLPDDFSIHETPAFVIRREDIKEVTISKLDKWGPSNFTEVIAIKLSNPDLIYGIKNYTQNHQYGFLLIEICGEISSSVRILDLLEDEIDLPLSKWNKEKTVKEIESVVGRGKIIKKIE